MEVELEVPRLRSLPFTQVIANAIGARKAARRRPCLGCASGVSVCREKDISQAECESQHQRRQRAQSKKLLASPLQVTIELKKPLKNGKVGKRSTMEDLDADSLLILDNMRKHFREPADADMV